MATKEPKYEKGDEGKPQQSEQEKALQKWIAEKVSQAPTITVSNLTVIKDINGTDIIVVQDFFNKVVLNLAFDQRNLEKIRGAFTNSYGKKEEEKE